MKRAKSSKIRVEEPVAKIRRSSWIDQLLFPSLPDHYTLRKKFQIAKNTSTLGVCYDISQDICSILMCAVYVTTTYYRSYDVVHLLLMLDIAISGYVMVDILFNWYLNGSVLYLLEFTAIVDLLSVFPTFFGVVFVIILKQDISFILTQLVSTLRLIRVIRIFKTLRFFHGIRRAELKLILTLACMVFVTAGIIQFLESDFKQSQLDCRYINEDTNWQPSCSRTVPSVELDSCDCNENFCEGLYDYKNERGKPSMVRCQTLKYHTAVYYIIITTAMVGYGDILPSTIYSKAIIILLIMVSLVTIPAQINELNMLLSKKSSYREAYKPGRGDNHVIVCGFVNNKHKVEQFFKEFFHPDRMFSSGPEFHAVLLCPVEPTEEVKNLIFSPMLDSRVTYVIGSALSVEDLKKVRADVASGMFFLCNTEVSTAAAQIEDATTVMRTLSVSNFNPDLECFVQVLRPEDRVILKDSDVEVILCLDEFKTTLMARNSLCPGFSTFVENIFHSFGNVPAEMEAALPPWYGEYLYGARMEFYYVPLDQDFLRAIDFSFDQLCESVYLEWGIVVLGLCNAEQDSITFNPSRKDLGSHKSLKSFFQEFNVALIMADDKFQAEDVSRGLSDVAKVGSILQKIELEEDKFPVRHRVSRMGKTVGERGKKRGLQRNRVLAPQQRSPGADIGKLGMSFLQKLQTKSFKGNAVRTASQCGDFMSDSDDSDNDEHYIGYAKKATEVNATDVLEGGEDGFTRASVMYTKSHSNVSNISDPFLKIEVNNETKKPVRKARQSIISKAMSSVPIVRSISNETTLSGGSRAARKSMVIPALKKKPIRRGSKMPIKEVEDDSGSNESDDMNKTQTENEGTDKPADAVPANGDMAVEETVSSTPAKNSGPETTKPSPQTNTLWPSHRDEKKIHPTADNSSGEHTPMISVGSISEGTNSSPSRTTAPFASPLATPVSRTKLPPLVISTEKTIKHKPKKKSKKKVAGPSSDLVSAEKLASVKKKKIAKIKVAKNTVTRGSMKDVLNELQMRVPPEGTKRSTRSGSQDYVVPNIEPGEKTRQYHDEEIKEHVATPDIETCKKPEKELELTPNKFNSVKEESPIATPDSKYQGTDMNSKRQSLLTRSARAFSSFIKSQGGSSRISPGPAEKSNEHVDESESTSPNIIGRTRSTSTDALTPGNYGLESKEVSDLTMLRNHIIVFGNTDCLSIFIPELRRPAVRGETYHPLVIVSPTEPQGWKIIKERYNDIYFLRGSLTRSAVFNSANIPKAFAVILFADRDRTSLELLDTNIDSQTLFTYLKLEQHIPPDVFFSVELTCSSNVAVLNSTIMRRVQKSGTDGTRAIVRDKSKDSIAIFGNIEEGLSAGESQTGRFTTKRTTLRHSLAGSSPGARPRQSLVGLPRPSVVERRSSTMHRRFSITEVEDDVEMSREGNTPGGMSSQDDNSFWDATDTHHVLPVFASARTYVPSSFESLLVQSFFGVLTPLICEKLVCGQAGQSVVQISMPTSLVGRIFVDMFRIFSYHHVICFGLYRAPQKRLGAALPYIYIAPSAVSVLHKHDRVFLYGKPSRIARAVAACKTVK